MTVPDPWQVVYSSFCIEQGTLYLEHAIVNFHSLVQRLVNEMTR